ncbi:carbohydrate-binding domain-containing protein [Draconibacterium sp. IB214405]|uniref:carbohydrate-binding domain-containing protein n=1 Tax=Draconibacterium sp. IB214405 TaxID=3097352 RepID=UPI002A0EA772|nr:carbohydrate-binding domain-containing protein [Draconibacterium sp. IB214405]MDX8339792.1 carbohydrate-binding domain-containing protein [Draconibacterium sp. IB214405]
MKQKTLLIFLVTFMFTFSFWSCDVMSTGFDDDTEETEEEAEAADNEEDIDDAVANNDGDHDETSDYTWSNSDVETVTLNGSSVTESSDNISVSGSKLTISAAGNYSFSGSLSNGQIIVDAAESDLVRLILDGVDISSSNSAPIYIKSAEKVIVVVNENTENTLSDGTSYDYDDAEDEEPNSTIFSKTNLTVFGDGKLTIDANFNDGINSKDGLIVDVNQLEIDAVDDGIRGKDYLIIKDGTINITSAGDGLKSDNDNDETRGYIQILTVDIDITAGGDAISAETDILIENGNFDLTTNGNSSYSDTSLKGLKSGVNLIVNAGTFAINSAEDAIHSDQTITLNGGTYTISASDDGIHADYDLTINSGDYTITKSYEGIESTSGDLRIDGGTFDITSSDDGLNVAAGGDSMGGGPGGWGKSATASYTLYLAPEFMAVNAQGDGLDSNGSVEMSDGIVIVNGPTGSGNGILDYDDSFIQTGGTLIGAGSSGMLQAPGSSSSINCVALVFRSTKDDGTLCHIETAGGEELVTFKPAKDFQAFIFSSPELDQGVSYNFYSGGSVSGTEENGYYTDATYSAGTLQKTFTLSQRVTGYQLSN